MEPGTRRESNSQNRTKRKPGANYLRYTENNKKSLLSCACSLICKTMKMTEKNYRLLDYMDEMLHSIFFLGYIHKLRLAPETFFKGTETVTGAKEMFPRPFEMYKSHLPTRTPFSILLDMMEIIHDTEENILTKLQKLLEKLKFPPPLHKPGNTYEQFYSLESTVICVCYLDSDPQRYYGASLSCRKGNAKRILIDVSCLKTWHELVSHAVMSFYPEGPGDGITFPTSVKCQAYFRDSNGYNKRGPCYKCHQLFNLRDPDPGKGDHPYGNCAEAECLSKLLLINPYIQEETLMENHTEENLQNLRRLTTARLTEQLQKVDIQMNDENILFYSPMQ
ncbi:uncharacterized protein LOC132842857 [Tachysurus vachellii]|uniref:uncharacterized protein LOC132842857 n=1 Tax=Tachysurus vachellii TaxID=175792 RepID=UPI00296ADAF7|nr:uncharacterized protein LOC132842857 [Tachysurus vachellii]XP_060721766.1 uncharacterized protein LOC132842857 [Tachysurus vachellii]XP_060721767.1 uncharacterized protein LOC132842857 [Tachysurus vachellii]